MCGRPKGFMKAIRLKSPRIRLDANGYRELCISGCLSATAGDAKPAGACKTCRSTTSNSAASQVETRNRT